MKPLIQYELSLGQWYGFNVWMLVQHGEISENDRYDNYVDYMYGNEAVSAQLV